MLLKISREDAKDLKIPRHYVGIFPGGAAHSAMGLIAAAFVEEQAGMPLSDLLTGGAIGSSAGCFGATAMAMPKHDDPNQQLFTMAEVRDRFFEKAPVYIPHTPDHYAQHIKDKILGVIAQKIGIEKSALELAFGSATLHYHTPPMLSKIKQAWLAACRKEICNEFSSPLETDLTEIMNGLTIDQARRSLCITSGKLCGDGSGNDRIEPYDFYKIEDGLLVTGACLPQQHPEINVRIVDAMMASISFPTVFKSHYIEATGTHHFDTALTDTGADNIAMMHANLQPGHSMGVVRFGSGDDNRPINPDDYNGWNALDMLINRFFFQADREMVHQRALRQMRATLGEEHVWNLNHRIVPHDEHDRRVLPSTDPLDTSPEQLELIQEFMYESIGRRRDDLYMPMIDQLVKNKALLDQAKPENANSSLIRMTSAVRNAFTRSRKPADNIQPILQQAGAIPDDQAASAAPLRA